MIGVDLTRELSPRRAVHSSQGLLTLTLLLVGTGCAKCAPERVGPGVARLTIRNVGTMASLVNADQTCGFSSPAVLAAPTVEGQIGGEGSLTFSVQDCVIDASAGIESKNCADVTTTATGKVTITAKRQVRGKLTGNPASPIIPSGPDAVTITLEKATFENFVVVSSASQKTAFLAVGSRSENWILDMVIPFVIGCRQTCKARASTSRCWP